MVMLFIVLFKRPILEQRSFKQCIIDLVLNIGLCKYASKTSGKVCSVSDGLHGVTINNAETTTCILTPADS